MGIYCLIFGTDIVMPPLLQGWCCRNSFPTKTRNVAVRTTGNLLTISALGKCSWLSAHNLQINLLSMTYVGQLEIEDLKSA